MATVSEKPNSLHAGNGGRCRQCDHAEIVRACNLIFEPGQVTELRALEATVAADRFAQTYSGYFDDWDKLARAAASIQTAGNIYIIPNRIKPALLARSVNKLRAAKKSPLTSDHDIERRRWLLLDCDPARPAGIASNDVEHNAAIEKARDVAEFLRCRGFPDGIIADSGNGGHILYRLDEPTDDDELIEKCLAALQHAAGDPGDAGVKIDGTCGNPARLWKLYGTLSGKGDVDAAAIGRPQRLARILEAPDKLEVVTHELLVELASEAPKPAEPTNGKHNFNGSGKTFDLPEWIRNHGLQVKDAEPWQGGTRWIFPTCPFNADHTNGSAVVVQRPGGQIGFKCHHNSCRGNDWHKLREMFEPSAYRHNGKSGNRQRFSQSDLAEFGIEADAATPRNAAPIGNSGNGQDHNGKAIERGPVLVCIADVEPREVEWVWPGRIPAGRITLLVGRPGAGKSFLCSEVTARVTTGSPWPDAHGKAPLGDVLIISAEDDAHDTIRPRLDAAIADVKRVHLLTAVRRMDSDGKPVDCIFTLADVLNLETALQRLSGCKLCIVDPIGSYLGSRIDAHRDNEVRGILAPIGQLAERYGVAMLVVAHRRKSGGDTADDTALGSRAFTGIARAVWHLSRDPQNKARRLLLPGKQNLSEEPDGLAFTIAGNPPCVQWEAEPVRMNADDALADERTPGPEPEQREAAATWLRGLLADGEVESKEVERQAKEAGLAWRTVRRAADDIGIKREKNAFSGKWQWRLPKPGNQLGQADGQHETSGQHGQHGQLEGETA